MPWSQVQVLSGPPYSIAEKHPAMKRVFVKNIIPSLVTVAALCVSLTGIKMALLGRFEMAVTCVLLAAVLDALDGRLARMLKATSNVGKELDSLADLISFGVTPALISYLWLLQTGPQWVWLAVLVFATCAALRLARFNTLVATSGIKAKLSIQFFEGVPSPAAAFLALTPLMATLGDESLRVTAEGLAIWLSIIALTMVMPLPTFTFKTLTVTKRMAWLLVFLVVLLVQSITTYGWLTAIPAAALYITTIPFAVMAYRKAKRQLA